MPETVNTRANIVHSHSDDTAIRIPHQVLRDLLYDQGDPQDRHVIAVKFENQLLPAESAKRNTLLAYARASDVIKSAELDASFLHQNSITIPDSKHIYLELSRCHPIELQEVVLAALDDETYRAASNGIPNITSALLIRQSSTCHIPHKTHTLNFRVMMCAPVLQGLLHAGTQILITNSSESSIPIPDQCPPSTPPFEIDEIDSILDVGMMNANVDSDGLYFSGGRGELVGLEESDGSRGFEASVTILKRPVSLKWLRVVGDGDIESAVFVGVRSLVAWGIFNGDMAFVEAKSGGRRRVVRVYGVDDFAETEGSTHQISIPPILAFNLSLSSTSTLTIHPIQNQKDSSLLVKPATEVTIARVAGRLTNDKQTLDGCLRRLGEWFEERGRWICDGDVLGIGVNEDRARLLSRLEEDDEGVRDLLRDTWSDDDIDSLAFFKVLSVSTSDRKHFDGTVRIDPGRTTLLQTGVVNSRVPGFLSGFYGFDIGRNAAPPTTTEQILTDIVSSYLYSSEHGFDINCTVLLHGAAGVGKKSLVKRVADAVGLHVFEASCFELVGDTNTRMEAMLQIWSEKAAGMAPCVFLVRGLEGLSGRASSEGKEVEEARARQRRAEEEAKVCGD
ncbi:peroxisomal assembly protein, partial [Rhizophlyctis rosea]